MNDFCFLQKRLFYSVDGDGIGDSPPIDGWNGTEYSLFANVSMFIGGKNNETWKRMATGYVAYDCNLEILVSKIINSIYLFD